MVDFVNKFVGFVVNPLFTGMVLVLFGLLLMCCKKIRVASWVLGAALAWFWFWSMPIVGGWLCLPLEEDFPVQLVEDMPEVDAIVVMGGGGMGLYKLSVCKS